MTKGISIHVGVNIVSPSAFNVEQVRPLKGCVNDAREMFDIAKERFHFDARGPFLGPAATFDNVVLAILEAAGELEDGDTFLFTFAGHGSQRSDEDNENVPDDDSGSDEDDHRDEGIVLFDSILIDDFLRRNLWSQFRLGVRIVGVADCCHGGTILSAALPGPRPVPDVAFPSPAPFNAFAADVVMAASHAQPLSAFHILGAGATAGTSASNLRPPSREITNPVRDAHIDAHSPFYQRLKERLLTGKAGDLKADLLTLSACRDDEETPDGEKHGVFTQALLDVLSAADSPANYDALRDEIEKKFRERQLAQTPVITPADKNKATFRTRLPFEI